ncbi:MAG: ATP-binding protein [Caulobacter sp.]|nr:ATP-binding protein [Caulobacter sp.]
MLAPLYRAMLESYFERTYGKPVFTRLASVAAVAGLTAYLHVWSLSWALVWAGCFTVVELYLTHWWKQGQTRLHSDDEATVFRLHRELIILSAGLANFAAIPCLITAYAGGPNALLGVGIAAGCLLIVAAQHSLHNMMFFATAPVAAVALVWNFVVLGQGETAWLFGLLGAFFVFNAATLHMANSASFTDLVKTQIAADEANKAKRVFLATMGHEIRTPMNGVLGMAQAMAMDDLSSRQRDRLNVISTSGEALLVLLNDLLDFSKIEAGKIEMEALDFDLRESLESACLGLAVVAADKGLAFRVDIAGVDGLYRGDPTRIRQIVQNLVSNAVKFTAEGRVTITARMIEGRLVLTVADTGIGMSSAGISRLFAEFVQVDGSTTRKYGGTGLGLAICRDLIRLMGGEITVESGVGEGSRFMMTLPMTRVGDSGIRQARPAVSMAPDGTWNQAPLRILVAEDNRSNQLVLKSLLAHTAAASTFVDNGAQAIEAFESGDWDVILMDIQMPVMDGMAATREIRRREALSGARRTLVYALTADAMSHQAAEHMEAGLDGHIAKPIQVAVLFGLLSEIAAGLDTDRDGAADQIALRA